jgi:hypothetical protein
MNAEACAPESTKGGVEGQTALNSSSVSSRLLILSSSSMSQPQWPCWTLVLYFKERSSSMWVCKSSSNTSVVAVEKIISVQDGENDNTEQADNAAAAKILLQRALDRYNKAGVVTVTTSIIAMGAKSSSSCCKVLFDSNGEIVWCSTAEWDTEGIGAATILSIMDHDYSCVTSLRKTLGGVSLYCGARLSIRT